MAAFLPHSRSLIGIDMGSDRVKFVQLARRGKGWSVAACGSMRRLEADTFTESEAHRLTGLIRRSGCTGDSAVVGVPRELEKAAVLDLPPKSSKAPILEICRAEVGRMYRLDPGAFEMHAWEMPATSTRVTGTHMVATAVPHARATELVGVLEEADLYVEAMDLTGCATARSAAGAPSPEGELTAVIDLGRRGLDLVVLRQGELVFYRRLENIGICTLIATIERKLGLGQMSSEALLLRVGLEAERAGDLPGALTNRFFALLREQADSMLREILASSSYALERFPGESISSFYITGGGAAIPGLAGFIGEISGLDVSTLSGSDLVHVPKRFGKLRCDPMLVAAIGHAMWEAAE